MSRKSRGSLKKKDEWAIKENFVYLHDNLDSANIICHHLFEADVFNKDDLEEISSCKTRKKKAEKLIKKMLHAGPGDAYEVFLGALEKEQEHIVERLQNSALAIEASERSHSSQTISRITTKKEKDTLLDKLDIQFAEIETLKKQNVSQNTEIEHLKKENITLKSIIEDLENDNVTLNTEIQKLKSEHNQLKGEKEKLSQMLDFEKRSNFKLQDLYDNYRRKHFVNPSFNGQIELNDNDKYSPSDASSMSFLQFISQIDETLVKILWAINLEPADPVWQEFLVHSAFLNLEKTSLLLLEMKKISPNASAPIILHDDAVYDFGLYVEPILGKRIMSPLRAVAANANYTTNHTTLQSLLDAGADVNAKDELGDTALIYLCRDCSTQFQYYVNKNVTHDNTVQCFDKLISKGNIDVKGRGGMTALMHCAKRGKSKYIEMLSLKVANMKIQCDLARTALMYATFYNADFDADCLQLLIEYSDMNATDVNGDTALIYSIRQNNVAVFDSLIKNESDVSIQNKKGINALMSAAISTTDFFLSVLLQHCLKLNEKDQDGNTALMMCAMYRTDMDDKCTKLLIDKREQIDFNAQNNNGETVLIKATQMCRLELVRNLIKEGANVNLRDKTGKTALIHARSIPCTHGDIIQSIIKHLIEAGGD